MRRPPVQITSSDLCAVDQLARDRSFTLREFANERSPWLTTVTARNVLRWMVRNGLVRVVARGKYAPTERGRQEMAMCSRKPR